jgi:hypothetical protein
MSKRVPKVPDLTDDAELARKLDISSEWGIPGIEPPPDPTEQERAARLTRHSAYADFASDPVSDDDINKFLKAERRTELERRERTKAVEKQRAEDRNGAGMVVKPLSDYTPRNVTMIWPGRLARGKHTALAGVGGIGKSQITTDIMSRCTRGSAWPDAKEILADGWQAEWTRAPIGNCIVLSAEDAPDDTILPRIVAAGGDPSRIHFVSMVKDEKGERKFSLQEDLDRLKRYATELGDVVLIVIDPASSYMGGSIDASKNTMVRSVLDPLTRLAEDLQCAVLSVTHFRKGSSAKAVDKVMDSVAFVNAPRVALGVYQNPDDGIGADEGERSYLLLPMKTNLPGKRACGLIYRIEGVTGGKGLVAPDGRPITTSRIRWLGKSTATADEVAQSESEKPSPKFEEAITFVRRMVPAEPPGIPVADIVEAAEAQGIAPDTLKRAKRKLGVKAAKVPTETEPNGAWLWTRRIELDL